MDMQENMLIRGVNVIIIPEVRVLSSYYHFELTWPSEEDQVTFLLLYS